MFRTNTLTALIVTASFGATAPAPTYGEAPPSADAILSSYVERIGGLDRLRHVRGMRKTGRMNEGPEWAPFVVYLKNPNLLRTDSRDISRLFDGDEAWQIVRRGSEEDGPIGVIEKVSTRDLMRGIAEGHNPLLDYRKNGHQLELLGVEQVDGDEAYHLQLTLEEGDRRSYFIGVDSRLLIKIAFPVAFSEGSAHYEGKFGDYRKVKDLLLPFRFEPSLNGFVFLETIYDHVELNPKLPKELFEAKTLEREASEWIGEGWPPRSRIATGMEPKP